MPLSTGCRKRPASNRDTGRFASRSDARACRHSNFQRKTTTKTLATCLAALASASPLVSAYAADADQSSADNKLTKSEAKDLKTESNAQYKSNKKLVQANEEQDKADCKVALEGGAKRSCVKSAKAAAKSDEYAAKAAHQVEDKSIDAAKK
jgi:hypothetical protein